MPYGADRAPTPVGTFTPKLQFNFKEKETTTGLYDYGGRMYNPATGRWLSADTSIEDGLNRYAYVTNNPVKYSDPTGHGAVGDFFQGIGDVFDAFGMYSLAVENCVVGSGAACSTVWNQAKQAFLSFGPQSHVGPIDPDDMGARGAGRALATYGPLLLYKASTNERYGSAGTQGNRPRVYFKGNDLMDFVLEKINPGGVKAPGRGDNCLNCSIATVKTLSGTPTVAEPAFDGRVGFEKINGRIQTELELKYLKNGGAGALKESLIREGEGAQAIVTGRGHIFNALLKNGRMWYVDSQDGTLIPQGRTSVVYDHRVQNFFVLGNRAVP
jgi:RHS repeat-associated protein